MNFFAGFLSAVTTTTARIDSCLSTATNIILQDADGSATNDAPCNAQLYRSGAIASFFNTDGYLDTYADQNSLRATPGFIRVVKSITYCDGTVQAIAGCTQQGTRNGSILSEAATWSPACGKYIAHEFGHSVGFPDTTFNLNVMRQCEVTSDTHLFASQCAAYRSDCADHDGYGGTPPATGCTTPTRITGADPLSRKSSPLPTSRAKASGTACPSKPWISTLRRTP